MKRKAFVFALLLGFTFGIFSKDIYVRSGAAGSGTKDAPYGYLWKAIKKAQRGDVIHVAEGIYYGKGGSGHFVISVPHLTLVGGYSKDFSERNPFKHLTILERAEDYRGKFTGLGEGIIEGDYQRDHSGLIIDGFVLNGTTRNAYAPDRSKIIPRKSWRGALIKAYSPNIKIRNSILINPYGPGIYIKWQGKENEVSNNFIINTFYTAISTRSAQAGSKILIKNNTVVFGWFQPGKGGSYGVFVGRQGEAILQDNIFAFLLTEGGEAGYAVSNTFGNDLTVLKGNIFYQCQGGYYIYTDEDGQSLVVWKRKDLQDLNEDPESYMLSDAGGNTEENPGIKPDKWYFKKFSGFAASRPGKLRMDEMNQLRRLLGLPLQAARASARSNWGMPYPLDKVIPNLLSPTGKGVRSKKTFETYASSAQPQAPSSYVQVAFDEFSLKAKAKSFSGQAVEFMAGIGQKCSSYFLKEAPRQDYECVKLLRPGESDFTRKYIFGYFLKGSEAHKKFLKYSRRKRTYNSRGGIRIRGKAYYIGNPTYSYPIGVIVYEVKKR